MDYTIYNWTCFLEFVLHCVRWGMGIESQTRLLWLSSVFFIPLQSSAWSRCLYAPYFYIFDFIFRNNWWLLKNGFRCWMRPADQRTTWLYRFWTLLRWLRSVRPTGICLGELCSIQSLINNNFTCHIQNYSTIVIKYQYIMNMNKFEDDYNVLLVSYLTIFRIILQNLHAIQIMQQS